MSSSKTDLHSTLEGAPQYEMKPAIAFDLHGLVLDHRIAKYHYFRDVVGVPYQDPSNNRREIVEHFTGLGYSPDFYLANLEGFFQASNYHARTMNVAS